MVSNSSGENLLAPQGVRRCGGSSFKLQRRKFTPKLSLKLEQLYECFKLQRRNLHGEAFAQTNNPTCFKLQRRNLHQDFFNENQGQKLFQTPTEKFTPSYASSARSLNTVSNSNGEIYTHKHLQYHQTQLSFKLQRRNLHYDVYVNYLNSNCFKLQRRNLHYVRIA